MSASKSASVDAFDMSQFHGVFFEETAENIAAFEEGLLHLDLVEPDAEQLNAIFRAAHSIKGGSGTFGFHPMAEVTHELETLLDLARRRETRLTQENVDGLLRANDVLAAQLAFYRGGGGEREIDIAPICSELRDMVADARKRGMEVPAPTKKKKPRATNGTIVKDEALATPAASDPAYGFFDDEPAAAAPPASPAAEQSDQSFGFFDNPGAPSTAATPATPLEDPQRRGSDRAAAPEVQFGRRASDRQAGGADTSIRVSVDKVDQLINMVGELVITQAMLAQSITTLEAADHEALFAGMTQLERNTRDLQESVMAVRMMPIAVVFNRFPRLARDLSGKLGKEVHLEIVGEGTELDKGLIEKMADPLTHLVRNSIDHGIEMPDERVAAGKPAQGTITLRASHQGGNVVVEVTDDGKGLDRDRILAKARERQIPVADNPSDADVWNLIFEAGFSTADVVTDLSGRGVGMDVVRRNIQALGGRVELTSATGQGTHTVIRLPLTLAILEGMSVGVADQTFIIPLSNVIESLSCDESQLKTISGNSRVIEVREEYIPVVSLRELFGVDGKAAEGNGVLVIIDAGGKRVALKVDELIGQHQVVIKSLESNYRRVEGISDVPAIVESQRK
jgi:two-component system chemotaxis sensor kinase CheA